MIDKPAETGILCLILEPGGNARFLARTRRRAGEPAELHMKIIDKISWYAAGLRCKPGRKWQKKPDKDSDSLSLDKERQIDIDLDLEIPVHLAVIMDGNGRWARQKGLPRQAGHRAGAENLKNLCRMCGRKGIKYLTVYAFSTENWRRPDDEVHALMELFVEFFQRYDKELAAEGIRLRFSGDLAALPENIRRIIRESEQDSIGRTSMQLIIAINYGGRRELVQAVQILAHKVRAGKLEPDDIDEEKIRQTLYLPDVPDPDLIIRPSGEQRLSNFLLWQSAYSEFWFSDVLWPDFAQQHLEEALLAYTNRDRRFGGVSST